MKTRSCLTILIIGGMTYFLAGCSAKGNENIPPVLVQVQKAEIFDGEETIAYSGTIEESESVPLSFGVSGTVLRITVSEGEFVKKGQLLATLNEVALSNVCAMSRATLEQAEDAYKRLKPMYEKGSLPEIKFVEVETGLQKARAAAAIAQKNLNDCNLYTPIDGFVGSRSIEPGMNVLPGITAIKIVIIEKVYAKVSISESEIAHIDKGQKASVIVGALGSEVFEGMVEEIGVMADPIAHTYRIKIGIPNRDNGIKPGMICEARIMTIEPPNSVVVSNQAVQIDEKGKTFVFSVDKTRSRTSRKYVETGRLLNNGIEIKNGLIKDELVVIAGQQKLVDNSPVKIVN